MTTRAPGIPQERCLPRPGAAARVLLVPRAGSTPKSAETLLSPRKAPSLLVTSTAALVGLLATLATLQYRWLGQVSEADAVRLRAGAQSRAEQFARDFDREATLAFLWLQVPAGAAHGREVLSFADRYARWRRTAAFPGLVRDVWLIEGEALFRFVPAARAFKPADWPRELDPLRPRRWPFQVIHEEVPAIVAPVPSLEVVRASVLRGEARFRLAGLSVIQLDFDHMRETLLPALARRHFGGAEAEYSLRVERPGGGGVLYRSDPDRLESGGPGDASVALLDVRLDLASREDLSLLRVPPTPEGAEMRHLGWLRRGAAPRRAESGRWRLVVTHRAGSVDAVVAAARRRNLAITGGVLALLAASAVLTAVSAQRARRLADRQLEFVASVSHELRTPVAVICSAGDNLAEGVVSGSETVQQYGRLVRGEGRRLAEMVERVLDYAGTYAGRRFWRWEELILPDLLHDALAALGPSLEEVGATVESAIAPDLPRVRGDRDALRRALQNLIQNAAKYGGDARFVGLRARAAEADGRTQVCITVEDHGLGHSAVGGGAHLRAVLPRRGGPAPPDPRDGPRAEPGQAHRGGPRRDRPRRQPSRPGQRLHHRAAGPVALEAFMRPHILLVEDDPGLLLTLTHRLDDEGYRVDAARDGEEGLGRALAVRFDLVILDVMLPRRSGFDVCRELRQGGVSSPVLMLTARGQVADRVQGLKLGADDYLAKPFEMAELLARVEARLRRGCGAAAPRVHRFADVEVDLRTAEVRRGGAPVELSAKEFLLLRYFVEHAGATLSRNELLDQVWGYDAMPTTRTVDVHVAWLRRKLEPSPRRPRHILTRHGLGYQFVG